MLDAADVSTIGLSGSSVVRWSDKSALHNDVAAAQTGAPPSYVAGRNGGLGNIAFNGQNQLLVGSNSAFSQNLFNESTVFIVSNQNAAKQDASVLWTGCFFCNPRWTLRLSEGPGNTPTFAFNNKTQGSGLLFAGGVASGPAIWTAAGSISAKTQFLNRDGVLVGSDGGPGAAVSGSYPEAIGAMYQAPKTATYYYGGSLGEVVVYNRLLAQSEYQLVEGGLACKWGLQNQLPVTHPYRYKCPGQLPSATTYHYDNARTGWDPNEQILNTSNVNAAHFGLKFSVPLDGEVYAEPLYVPQVAMSGGVHNLLVAATENATVYGIDADSGAVLWKTPFANPPNVIASIAIGANSNVAGPNGLTGTPTIDVARDSIYVVGHTDEGPAGSQTTHYRLHALRLEDGSDRVPSTDISLSNVATDGTIVKLDPVWSIQRPGLAENNGVVYVSFGSAADFRPTTSTGWLAGYDANTLAPVFTLGGTSTANGLTQSQNVWFTSQPQPVRMAAIWQSGAAPAIDGAGNLYVQTGNGAFDGAHDWGMSLLKVAPNLASVVDYFTPSSWQSDSNYDTDLGSAGVLLLPQGNLTRSLAIGGGKSGMTYMLDATNLGKLGPSGDPNALFHTQTNSGLWGQPAAYVGSDGNTYLIVPGSGPMSSWKVTGAPTASLTKVGQTADHFADGDDGGTIPVISSNGTAPGSAIVWAYSRVPNGGPADLTLRAYDASNLSNKLVEVPFTHWTGGGMLANHAGRRVRHGLCGRRIRPQCLRSSLSAAKENSMFVQLALAALLDSAAARPAVPLGQTTVEGIVVGRQGRNVVLLTRNGQRIVVDARGAAGEVGRNALVLTPRRVVVARGVTGSDRIFHATAIAASATQRRAFVGRPRP